MKTTIKTGRGSSPNSLANLKLGHPFKKGESGHPCKRTPGFFLELARLQAAMREHTVDAVHVILDIMQNSPEDRVRLQAADLVLTRGFGKALEAAVAETAETIDVIPENVRVDAVRSVAERLGFALTPCSNTESSPDSTSETADLSDASDAKESVPPETPEPMLLPAPRPEQMNSSSSIASRRSTAAKASPKLSMKRPGKRSSR